MKTLEPMIFWTHSYDTADFNQQLEIINTHVDEFKKAFLCDIPNLEKPETLRKLFTLIEYINKKHIVLNSQNAKHETGLSIAVQKNNLPVVQHLIAAGASMTMADENDLLPLHHAAFLENTEILKLLLDKITSFEQEPNISFLKRLKRLIEGRRKNRLLNQRDILGCTALSLAVQSNNYQAVVLLLQAGALLTEADNLGLTVLHHTAPVLDNTEILEILLAKIISSNSLKHKLLNKQNQNNQTALCLAISANNLAAVMHLLFAGASIETF